MPFFKALMRLLNTVKRYSVAAVLVGLIMGSNANAATLAPDSVEALYHGYDGGGMEIDGPFIVARKGFGDKVSVHGHYYVDTVSSASIDVLSFASPYEEERTEYSVGADFLHEKSILSVGFTNSEENDYSADSLYFALTQDFFGDLTTLSMSYGRGWDEIGKRNEDFNAEAERQNFKIGVSQVVTKNSLLGFDIETITNEGLLRNPYRQYRFRDGTGFGHADEIYPDTRTSTAIATRFSYFLPYRAALKGEYRFFSDSWGIKAHTYEVQYVHPIGPNWTLEGRYRMYNQTKADFYQDIFAREGEKDQMARDKEMSTFSNYTLGFGVTYEFLKGSIKHVDKLKLTALFDYLDFSYDDFRDLTKNDGTNTGNEPLYGFDAWVTRISVTLDY